MSDQEIVSNLLKELHIKEGDIPDQTFLGWFKGNLYKREFQAKINGSFVVAQIEDLVMQAETGQTFIEISVPGQRETLKFHIPSFFEAVRHNSVQFKESSFG